jgi:hypothetical protein
MGGAILELPREKTSLKLNEVEKSNSMDTPDVFLAITAMRLATSNFIVGVQLTQAQ